MKKKFDCLIIGAGIIGCALSFEMAKNGMRSLVVDKQGSAGAGSTANSCAIIRTHYSTLDGIALAWENIPYWKNWSDYLELSPEKYDLAKYHQGGMTIVKGAGWDHKKMIDYHNSLGIPLEDWDLKTLLDNYSQINSQSHWPVFRPEDDRFWIEPKELIAGALRFPEAGYINDPQLSTQNLQWAAEAKGAEFLFNNRVMNINRSNGGLKIVTLSDGSRLETQIVVNAAGPHSYIVNDMAGVLEDMKISTKALRHEVHFIPAVPNAFDRVDFTVWGDSDVCTYGHSENGIQVLIGSEDPECDPKIYVDPDQFYNGQGGYGRDNQVTAEQYKAQTLRFTKRWQQLSMPNKPAGVVDLYDQTEDWLPLYDKSCLDGFYMCVGTSGNQYKNAPVVAKMMVKLIEYCENGGDHDDNPLCFDCKHSINKINLATFSRRREINPNSSFSVRG
jgi:sarcosine oxidase subunit beta